MLLLLGIKFIALLYFVAGAVIGMYMRQIATGQSSKLNNPEPGELVMALLNFILIPCWLAMWKRRKADKNLSLSSPELQVKSLFLQGLPTNQRIALGIWGAAWLTGFILSVVWDIFG